MMKSDRARKQLRTLRTNARPVTIFMLVLLSIVTGYGFVSELQNKLDTTKMVEAKQNNSEPDPLLRVAWCVPSIFGSNLSLVAIAQWETHYQALGVTKAFIYTVTHTPEYVKQYIDSSSFFEVSQNGGEFKRSGEGAYYFGQDWAIQDCFSKVKQQKMDWAGFGDLDEFIWWNSKEMKITEWLLNNYNDNGCLTLGKRFHSMKVMYQTQHSKFDMYSMPFTPTLPYCYESVKKNENFICDDWVGRRKFIINLRHISDRSEVGGHFCLGFKNTKILHVDNDGCFHEWWNYLNFRFDETVQITTNTTWKQQTPDGSIPSYAVSHISDQYPLLYKDETFLEFAKLRYLH